MDSKRYLSVLCGVIWLLVVLHVAAEVFYLYWTFFWFDYLTHFLGGLWVGLATVLLILRVRRPSSPALTVVTLSALAIIGTVLVGVAWELYEYIVWTQLGTGLPLNYHTDTFVDIIMDLAGGLVGLILALSYSRAVRTALQKTPA